MTTAVAVYASILDHKDCGTTVLSKVSKWSVSVRLVASLPEPTGYFESGLARVKLRHSSKIPISAVNSVSRDSTTTTIAVTTSESLFVVYQDFTPPYRSTFTRGKLRAWR